MRFTLSCRHVFARHFSQLAAAGRRGQDLWVPWIGSGATVLSAFIIETNAWAWRAEVRLRHAEDRARAEARHAKDRARAEQDGQLIGSIESRVEILQAGHEEDRQVIRSMQSTMQDGREEYRQVIRSVESTVDKLQDKLG